MSEILIYILVLAQLLQCVKPEGQHKMNFQNKEPSVSTCMALTAKVPNFLYRKQKKTEKKYVIIINL